jgi:hypothetical protein
MWLLAAKRAGLCYYVSRETVGFISYAISTWFTGHNEQFFFGKGVYYSAVHPHSFWIWRLYTLFRYRGKKALTFQQKRYWMNLGRRGYREMKGYGEFVKNRE